MNFFLVIILIAFIYYYIDDFHTALTHLFLITITYYGEAFINATHIIHNNRTFNHNFKQF